MSRSLRARPRLGRLPPRPRRFPLSQPRSSLPGLARCHGNLRGQGVDDGRQRWLAWSGRRWQPPNSTGVSTTPQPSIPTGWELNTYCVGALSQIYAAHAPNAKPSGRSDAPGHERVATLVLKSTQGGVAGWRCWGRGTHRTSSSCASQSPRKPSGVLAPWLRGRK
jgi:hypothetical protein